MKIVFDATLATGNELVDGQHRELLRRAEVLVESPETVPSPATILGHFRFFHSYMLDHFADEEALMGRAAYPALPGHRKEHDYFRGEMDALLGEIAAGGFQSGHYLRLHVLIVDRLLGHFRGSDRPMAAFIRSRGQG